ncbi:MAG: WD40/YVTN/BNR-like repeat-containing protein, partial [Planctomycetota bacterium]
MKRHTAVLVTVLLALAITPWGAGAADWTRCGGPLGGLGYDVRMHPGSSDTMFVTDSFAGAFKSIDSGQSWYPINTGIDIFGGLSGDAIKVFCLTIDPNDPNIVWCGIQDYRGLFKSTDGGETWTEKTNGIVETEGLSFRGITIQPGNSDIVYAAAEVSSSIWNGSLIHGWEWDKTKGVVYKTFDGGENWFDIWRGDNLARYIWINPSNTDVLYASTGFFDREAANCDTSTGFSGGAGIIKSIDAGQTWLQKNNGLTSLYIPSLSMHPTNPDILLAGSSNGRWDADSAGVFLTINGAESWTRVLAHGAQSVEFALSNPDTAYAGNGSAVFLSIDGGHSWFEKTPKLGLWGPPGVEAGQPVDFQVDPDDASRIFTNNYGGGNFLSVDAGSTWTVASQGYTGAHVRDIAVAPDDPARVYAAARTGIFRSQNWGVSWSGRNFLPALENEWNVVTVDPRNPLLLLGSGNKTVTMFASYDGAETWMAVGPQLPEHIHWRCITFAPADSNLVYAGTGATLTISQFESSVPAQGIYKSVDRGETWVTANDTTSDTAHVADISVVDSVVVYAATTNLGVLKTIDGGGNWTVRNQDLPGNPAVLSIGVDPADTSHVLAGLQAAGLYVSFNGALTWESVPVGLPAEAEVSAILFSSVDPAVVWMGDRRSGVYRSIDGGGTWVKVNYGLRTRAVNALALSADNQTLYAGTEGEGVFRLDGAPTVGVRDTPPAEDVLLLQS